MKRPGMLVLAAAILSSSSARADGGPIDLSPRFVVGQAVRYGDELTMTQKQKYGQFDEDAVSLQMLTELRFVVTRLLDDGGAEVDISFDRISIDAVPSKSPRITFDTEIDHDRPDDVPFIRAIRRVAESVVTVELSAAGQVRSIVGADEIARLVEGLPGFGLIAGVWDEAWFRQLARNVYGAGGDAPSRQIGDSWDTQLALTLGGIGGARTKVRWTLEQVRSGLAVIEGKGETKPPVRADADLNGLDQKITGRFSRFSMRWSLELGRAKSVETSEAMNLEYRAGEYALGTVSLGTHELLQSLDP